MASNFMTNFHQQVIKDNIKVGDTVTIIGKDDCKGLLGTVTSLKQSGSESLYIIELHANSKRIERAPPQLRKEYP